MRNPDKGFNYTRAKQKHLMGGQGGVIHPKGVMFEKKMCLEASILASREKLLIYYIIETDIYEGLLHRKNKVRSFEGLPFREKRQTRPPLPKQPRNL